MALNCSWSHDSFLGVRGLVGAFGTSSGASRSPDPVDPASRPLEPERLLKGVEAGELWRALSSTPRDSAACWNAESQAALLLRSFRVGEDGVMFVGPDVHVPQGRSLVVNSNPCVN